jgi:2-polyprenyl-3-methyl-5-hydroxy-6-metoxy-1,4-benzoquinol methylase
MVMKSDFFTCLNCSGSNVEISANLWKCKNCGKQYQVINNIPILVQDWQLHKNELDSLASIKPNWYELEQDPEETSIYRYSHIKRREYIEKKINTWLTRKNIDRVDKLLDLGCGDGNHLSYLQNYAKNTYGSDYNLTRLVRSSLRFPEATFFLADLLNYPSKQNFFDLIFFHHVIEHIENDISALENIYKILSPGGLLFLGTPNEGSAWWQFAYRIQPEMRTQTDHVQFFTADSLKSKLEKVGFMVLEIKHLGWGIPHFSLDEKFRRYKVFDDLFESVGHQFFEKQATSLYFLATKE